MSSKSLTNIVPIWTPQDAIDTAEAFHRETANAERGAVVIEEGRHRTPLLALVADRGSFLLSRSRERKARAMDALAVSLLLALMAAIGAFTYFSAVPR